MTIEKTTANRILSNLDTAAQRLEGLAKSGKIDPRLASSLIRDIDGFADRFEVAAFGKGNLQRRMAKVLKRDPDEKYMETFENVNKPLKTEPDEEFMHKVGPSFNAKGIGTYDVDRSSTVSERDEYAVRDVSEWADGTKKQPSWARGPAGKSTKQGSTRQASVAPRGQKTWAP